MLTTPDVTAAPVRRRWVVPFVVAVTVPGLALSAVSTWRVWQLPDRPSWAVAGAPAARVPGSTQSDSSTARQAAERMILEHRAEAVRTGDRAKFLADLDPTNAGLRTRQNAIFTGLTRLDFSTFSYSLSDVSYDRASISSAYDAPVHVEGVESAYSLKGFDHGPVVEAQAVTFVQRQGRWWFASDRDADGQLPAAGHAEPWDDGEIAVSHGKHSLVIGPAQGKGTVQRVAKSVDQAVAADTKFWPIGTGDHWNGKVVVYVPDDQREFTSLFRGSKQSADGVVAVAIQVYDQVSWRKGGRAFGTANGSRVIINPRYFRPNSSYFSVILRHEVSHVAAEPVTANATPTWFVEGLAEYVGWRRPNPSQTFFARGVDDRTAAAINARRFTLTLPSSNTFYQGSDATIAEHYTHGFLACAYIQHRWGEAKLKKFAARLGTPAPSDQESRVLKSALRKTFGVTKAQFESGGTAWLRNYRIGH